MNQLMVVLRSGRSHEFFVTADKDGSLAKVPEGWAHKGACISHSHGSTGPLI